MTGSRNGNIECGTALEMDFYMAGTKMFPSSHPQNEAFLVPDDYGWK
jgi:hypothetical protein